jgi:site-specific recombinase XerD
MNTPQLSAAARFDQALQGAWKKHIPQDRPRPKPSALWPKENIAILGRYEAWLLGGGTPASLANQLYLPAAGYALGLILKPYPDWDFQTDIPKVHDYITARKLNGEWNQNNHNALERFRRFLGQQRGEHPVRFRTFDRAKYCVGLPDWLVAELERYQHLRQANWRPARTTELTYNFWGAHTRPWRWLFTHYPLHDLADLKRPYLLNYIDSRLTAGYAARTINGELRSLHAFLLFLQDQDYRVPQALLRLATLKEPECLPRYLTDDQVRCLRDDLELRFMQSQTATRRRDALLDRAVFYLLWQCGLRLGEVEELRLEDVDLAGRKLMVRQGKGRKDRAVYLTDTTSRALAAYFDVRGMGPTDHIFFYRNAPLQKDLIRARIKASGARTGVDVSPHKLRHTCATQLLNAGCHITTIQKLLGHRQLGTTMIYARVHDHTAAEDYYTAMARIEKTLDLSPGAGGDQAVSLDRRAQRHLLEITKQLAAPRLLRTTRLDLVRQFRRALKPKAAKMAATALC